MFARLSSLLVLLLSLSFGLMACQGHAPDGPAQEPASSPTTQESQILPNDGTRVVGDITRCPVSGDVFTVSSDSPKVEQEGKTYYMCCDGCVDKFKADPDKFLSAAHHPDAPAPLDPATALPNDGTRVVGDVTRCPVSGKTFAVSDKSPKVELEGKTYYMCCKGCVDKFKAEPEKYLGAR